MKKILALSLLLYSFTTNKPSTKLTYVPAPKRFERLVDSHVKKIIEQDYADSLSSQDLFHGHVYVLKKDSDIRSVKDFSQKVKLILYHTREYVEMPKKYSKSRNILGFLDGSIQPLENLVDVTNSDNFDCELFQEVYKTHNTYFSSQIPLVADSLENYSPHINGRMCSSQIEIDSLGHVFFAKGSEHSTN